MEQLPRISVGLEAGIGCKWPIQQSKNRASGAESGKICAVIRAKSQANGSSIAVVFWGHGFYSSYTSDHGITTTLQQVSV
jgi:hypothetical protein